MKKEETKFKETLLPKLKKVKGSWFEKIQQVSINGTPDILGVVRGWMIAIELKTDDGETTALQDLKLDRIKKAGGVAMTVTPKTAQATLTFLNNLEWRK